MRCDLTLAFGGCVLHLLACFSHGLTPSNHSVVVIDNPMSFRPSRPIGSNPD
jgi:hypothetical protein